jgi:hypothetical protein
MPIHIKRLCGLTLGFMILAASITTVQAQNPPPRLLTLSPPTGLPVLPIMEGWYPNPDGSVTISFGFVNRNTEEAVDIPIGPNNFIEPAEFNGMQPTHFGVDRQIGAFTVTLPAERRNESIWWHLKTGEHPVAKVPGRAASTAYELDRNQRPQGSIEPEAWLVEGGPRGAGPGAVVGNIAVPAKVGVPFELKVHTEDKSVRDPQDPRFQKPLTLRTTFIRHQGPGSIVFSKHEAHAQPIEEDMSPRAVRLRGQVGPEVVTLQQPAGTAHIYATFSEPGEYIVRARIDNWNAPDSSAGNQCCWTNVFQRITVVP